MKKYADIMKEIDKKGLQIRKLEEEKSKARVNLQELRAGYRAGRFTDNAEFAAAYKEQDEKISAISAKISDLNLYIKYLRDNAKQACYSETLPAVLEILNKYAGKPYGEKTRAKIAEECKQATGVCVYICSRYSSEYLSFSCGDAFRPFLSFEVCPRYIDGKCKDLRIDNKVCPLSADDIEICFCGRYVEDIPAQIRKIKKLKAQAVKLQKELSDVCSAYNNAIASDMDTLDPHHSIY